MSDINDGADEENREKHFGQTPAPTPADERARLRALAEKAAPGPWEVAPRLDRRSPLEVRTVEIQPGAIAGRLIAKVTDFTRGAGTEDFGIANARLIAALSPGVVLRLLDDVERAERERADFHMDYRMKCDVQTKAAHARVEQLEAELFAARTRFWDARAERLEAALRRTLSALLSAQEFIGTHTGYKHAQADEVASEARAALAEPTPAPAISGKGCATVAQLPPADWSDLPSPDVAPGGQDAERAADK